jgi:hypothetical protein
MRIVCMARLLLEDGACSEKPCGHGQSTGHASPEDARVIAAFRARLDQNVFRTGN